MSLIKEFMILCQFTLPLTEPIIASESPPQQKPVKDKLPELCVYKSKDEVLMKDTLNSFDTKYQEIHYQVSSSNKFDGNMFIYNPEIVLKVSPITVVDRL